MLEIKNLSFIYDQHYIFKSINLSVKKGSFISIVGKSGVGKSTLVKIITGLLTPYSGSVLLDGNPAKLGQISYMPQKDLLLPWKTVKENIKLIELLKSDVKLDDQHVDKWIDMAGLKDYAKKYPSTLSGGMRQRAAFLRTLLTGNEVLLLDEPFGALDSLTKKNMQSWLLQFWSSLNKTIIFITHDLEEAIYMSDAIYLLDQDENKSELIPINFTRPRSAKVRFSSEFIRIRNDLEGRLACDEK